MRVSQLIDKTIRLRTYDDEPWTFYHVISTYGEKIIRVQAFNEFGLPNGKTIQISITPTTKIKVIDFSEKE